MKFKSVFAVAALVAGAALVPNVASAATSATYNFSSLLSGSGPNTTTSFASLSVSSTDDKVFTFTLNVLSNFASIFGKSADVTSILFNTASNVDPKVTSANVISGTGGVTTVTQSTADQKVGGVTFDFSDSFGNGWSELTSGESVKWTATFANVVSPLLASSNPVALYVTDITGKVWSCEAEQSYYSGTVSAVPEAETSAMLLAGLGLMGAMVRRRKAKQA